MDVKYTVLLLKVDLQCKIIFHKQSSSEKRVVVTCVSVSDTECRCINYLTSVYTPQGWFFD